MNAEDLLKGGGSAEDALKAPAKPAEKPKHPWQAVTEASFDRSKQIPGTENLPHPAQVIGDTAAMLLVPGAGGPLARSAMSGAIGAATAAGEGKNPLKRGLADTATSLIFEGIMGGLQMARLPFKQSLGQVAEHVATKKGEFARATGAIDEAFDALKGRIPTQAWMYVPAIDRAKLLTPDQVRAGWKNLESASYGAARQQVLAELKRFDKEAVAYGGRSLHTASDVGRTSKERFTPPMSGLEKFAEGAVGTLRDPALRGATDIAATADAGGVPAGALPIIGAMEGLGGLGGMHSDLRALARRALY